MHALQCPPREPAYAVEASERLDQAGPEYQRSEDRVHRCQQSSGNEKGYPDACSRPAAHSQLHMTVGMAAGNEVSYDQG